MTRAGWCLVLILALGCWPREVEPPAAPAETAEVYRQLPASTLGVRMRNPTAQERKDLGLSLDQGVVLVADVLSRGPAAKARLEPGDWIMALEGVPVPQLCAFYTELRKYPPGRSVRLAIRRANATFEPEVTLAEAWELHKGACLDGKATGCFLLGIAEINPGYVMEPFERACKLGLAEGCVGAGDALRRGVGTPKDEARALRLFEQACRDGSAQGCAFAAFQYATGQGVPRNDARATNLYVRACEGGDPVGCYNMGLMYGNARGTVEDLKRARDAYAVGCAGGSSLACTNLGYMYQHGMGVDLDETRAADLYQRGCEGNGCEKGDPIGCVDFGILLRHGWGVPQDKPRAVRLFDRACRDGQTGGCERLGIMLSTGEGVPRDRARAMAALQLACDTGDNPKACEELARLRG